MNTKQYKVLMGVSTWVVLPLAIIALTYLLVDSIMQPVNFQKEQRAREQVGIARLKDVRELQDAYKSVHGKYTEDMDSLIIFYNTGKIVVKR